VNPFDQALAMQFFTAILSALALAVLTTTATPVDSDDRAGPSGAPEILSPKAGDIWHVANTTALVTWDPTLITKKTENYKDYIGSILLGFDDGTSSLHLDDKNPLAQGIKMGETSQSLVTVPTNTSDGTNYYVARKSPLWGVGSMP